MTHAIGKRSARDAGSDERLNEQFHTLLREAADKREGRARTQSKEDSIAAAEESRALFALARGTPAPESRIESDRPADPPAVGRSSEWQSE
jgi:hypothetical protein